MIFGFFVFKRCVAQLVEQETFNLLVAGSIPAAPTKFKE